MFYLSELTDETATFAWRNARSGSLFCSPELLREMNIKTKFYGGYKNDQLLAVWPLIDSGIFCGDVPPFSYYFGPYFVRKAGDEKPYKQYRNILETITAMIPQILGQVPRLHFSLVPDFDDIRAFQWWNYHTPELGQFKADVRYTARVDTACIQTDEQQISMLRADDKRKKLRKIKKLSECYVTIANSFDIDECVEIYQSTVSRSGGSISLYEKDMLKIFLTLTMSRSFNDFEFRVLKLCKSGSKHIEGFQLLLSGQGVMYAIAQGVTKIGREMGGSLLLNYEALALARREGYLFDFNGANSPKRADDKHAFGAKAVKYFDLTFER